MRPDAPLSPAFAGLGWLAARLRRQTGSPRAVLWSVGALAPLADFAPDALNGLYL